MKTQTQIISADAPIGPRHVDRMVAGPGAKERADRLLAVRQRIAKRKKAGLHYDGAPDEKVLVLTEDQLAAAGMFDLNGVVYSSRERRDAVRAALQQAGAPNVYPDCPEGRAACKSAGINTDGSPLAR